MECEKKYKQENILEYTYTKKGKILFKVRYDLNLDINYIFKSDRPSSETMEQVYSPYKQCLSKKIPEGMSKLFLGESIKNPTHE